MPGGRPPKGATSAERSRTAVVGAVAARASLYADADRMTFFDQEGLHAASTQVKDALRRRMRQSREPFDDDPAERDWIWETYDVDAAKLELDVVVAWLPRPAQPGSRPHQGELLAALRDTPGVVRLQDCMDDTIVVTAVATSPTDRRRLQTCVRELCPEALWAEVRGDDPEQARRGWLRTAKVVAKREGRLRT